jgi:hypothetical protein
MARNFTGPAAVALTFPMKNPGQREPTEAEVTGHALPPSELNAHLGTLGESCNAADRHKVEKPRRVRAGLGSYAELMSTAPVAFRFQPCDRLPHQRCERRHHPRDAIVRGGLGS